MISLQLLEDEDTVEKDDWFRPIKMLTTECEEKPCLNSFNMYGGSPINNIKWIRVSDCYNECWYGKKVKELNKFQKCEFVRGDMPKEHIWDWRETKELSGWNELSTLGM